MWAFPRPTGTIVVGCDTSRESRHAVVAATVEASRRGMALVLLAVGEQRPYWPDNLARVFRAEAESAQIAHEAADRALALVVATDPAVAVQAVFVKDLDSPELAGVARRAGLLVLGQRGDGGQVTFSLGSTSAELARRFHCPMLVVHAQVRPGESDQVGQDAAVFAGIDTSHGADAVLSVALTEAVIRDLPLVVVHGVQRADPVDRAVVAEGWRRCRAALRQACLPAGIPSRLVITQADPVPALLHRVGPRDLLVVGTRGRACLAGLITGSVSREVLDKMTCDVLVVQPGLKPASAMLPSTLVGLAGRS